MKAVVAAFNQEKALVGAFSVIVQLHRLIDLRHYIDQKMQFSDNLPQVGGKIYPVAIKYDAKFGDAFWNSSR